jgi:hypothetical protein
LRTWWFCLVVECPIEHGPTGVGSLLVRLLSKLACFRAYEHCSHQYKPSILSNQAETKTIDFIINYVFLSSTFVLILTVATIGHWMGRFKQWQLHHQSLASRGKISDLWILSHCTLLIYRIQLLATKASYREGSLVLLALAKWRCQLPTMYQSGGFNTRCR